MAALKTLVIVLGVLILAGLAAVSYGVLTKFSGDGAETESPADAGPGRVSVAVPFGDVSVDVPAGARVEETDLDGGRLVVRLAMPDGETRLIVIDLAHGAVLGSVRLRPAPQ